MAVMLKRECLMLKNQVFCLVSFSSKFWSYCQESNKANSNFSIFENIRVTVSLDGTFTHSKKIMHGFDSRLSCGRWEWHMTLFKWNFQTWKLSEQRRQIWFICSLTSLFFFSSLLYLSLTTYVHYIILYMLIYTMVLSSIVGNRRQSCFNGIY